MSLPEECLQFRTAKERDGLDPPDGVLIKSPQGNALADGFESQCSKALCGEGSDILEPFPGHTDLATTTGYAHLLEEHLLARRLMAGHRSLEPAVVVRIHPGQLPFPATFGPPCPLPFS
jgi:hypothetical protein